MDVQSHLKRQCPFLCYINMDCITCIHCTFNPLRLKYSLLRVKILLLPWNMMQIRALSFILQNLNNMDFFFHQIIALCSFALLCHSRFACQLGLFRQELKITMVFWMATVALSSLVTVQLFIVSFCRAVQDPSPIPPPTLLCFHLAFAQPIQLCPSATWEQLHFYD